MSAPLLTPRLAQMFIDHAVWSAPPSTFDNVTAAITALRDGRTRCVEVLDEAGHRARFEEWAEAEMMPLEHSNWFKRNEHGEYVIDGFNREWAAWLACARANGLVKEKKV